MFTSLIFLLLPFLMVAFLPLTINAFSRDELDQMGVHLESSKVESACNPVQGSNHILTKVTIACMHV